MKKRISAMLSIAMLLTILAGCGNSSAPAGSSADASKSSGSPTASSSGSAGDSSTGPSFEEGMTFDVMEFVTGPSGGGWAQIGAAIADKANGYFSGFPITATTGGRDTAFLLNSRCPVSDNFDAVFFRSNLTSVIPSSWIIISAVSKSNR